LRQPEQVASDQLG